MVLEWYFFCELASICSNFLLISLACHKDPNDNSLQCKFSLTFREIRKDRENVYNTFDRHALHTVDTGIELRHSVSGQQLIAISTSLMMTGSTLTARMSTGPRPAEQRAAVQASGRVRKRMTARMSTGGRPRNRRPPSKLAVTEPPPTEEAQLPLVEEASGETTDV